MPGAWWTRFGFAAVLAVFATLLLIPTLYQRNLEDTNGDGRINEEDERPGWYDALDSFFGGRHITWGLDLQGGLHLQYQVDVDKAISDKLDRYVEDLTISIGEEHPEARFEVERVVGDVALVISSETGAARELIDGDAVASMNLDMMVQADGDVRLVMQQAYIDETRQYAIDQAIATIRKRIDALGVAEPSISRRGDQDIIVQLPGLSEEDFETAKNLIAQTAVLEFKMISMQSPSFIATIDLPEEIEGVNDSPGSAPTCEPSALDAFQEALAEVDTPEGTQLAVFENNVIDDETGEEVVESYGVVLLEGQTRLTGEYITDARVSADQRTNMPVVSMEFDSTGGRLFCELTTDYTDRQMAIVLDGVVKSAPNINEPICGGRAQISMGRGGSYQTKLGEAEALAIVLRNGALPAPIEKQFETQVGPTLGEESIKAGAMSLGIAFGLVFIFVLIYYKLAGVVANVALLLNVIFIGAALAMFGATLTLPGIAGITLTIGMAVDANVIIFERIKEERRLGKTMRASVNAGYEKALSAVLDANITTGIAGIVLLQFGSGPVKGFAVTLLIGILSSLFTALFVTRILFDFLLDGRKSSTISI